MVMIMVIPLNFSSSSLNFITSFNPQFFYFPTLKLIMKYFLRRRLLTVMEQFDPNLIPGHFVALLSEMKEIKLKQKEMFPLNNVSVPCFFSNDWKML